MRPEKILYRMVAFILFLIPGYAMNGQVQIWEETISLPTYEPKAPDKNPMFYVPDAYQGAKRVIYPYPLMDNLSTEASEKEYRAVFLENEYIKLCVLPELGGRLLYATDKTNNYEMFYRQHVIKPANIGMLGAWISGGIEWCVFHHHRASTFLPVEYRLIENTDGSGTIWFGEIEPRQRMKWSIGLTLYPGRNYVEADVRMFNPTGLTHSFLYWANVATHANEDYQVIFPPSVTVGTYHAKNSFLHWPIADEIYHGRDYTGQVDVSWWRNHPDPISIFAYDLKEDFMGGYDHGRNAGTVHVGNHHIVKGAKLWEWGPGEYGQMWDSEILTDEDGPYAELMVGAYSDNQPDYSWIKPGEVKRLKQYWYPVRDIGGFKNANLNAAVNLEQSEGNYIRIGINTTRALEGCRVILTRDGEPLFEDRTDIAPDQPYTSRVRVERNPDLRQYTLRLIGPDNRELITYHEQKREADADLPSPVTPPKNPSEIENLEELFLTGQRIMQFHNPGLDPEDYFQEVLRRDPYHSAANLLLGSLAEKAGQYREAADYYRHSIQRITGNYTRPRDCEALFRLGVVLKKQKNYEAATDTLYRATWDQDWYAAAYSELAGISMLQGRFEEALDQLNRSISLNDISAGSYAMRSAVLRHLNDLANAGISARRAQILDPLDHMASFELLLNNAVPVSDFTSLMNQNKENYLELACSYIRAGLNEEAARVVDLALSSGDSVLSSYPILHYYRGWLAEQLEDQELAARQYTSASSASTDYVFPFRFETLDILRAAISYNAQDAKAWYYMGNILYDHQPSRALIYWNQAVKIDPGMDIAYRNLGWGYYRFLDDIEGAIRQYETALSLNRSEPRYYLELDRLYEMNNESPEKRYAMFADNREVVMQRQDVFLRALEVMLLNGENDSVLSALNDHTFLRQEGVVRLHDLFVDAELLKGREYLLDGNYEPALEHFLQADTYPANQRIGRLSAYPKEAQIFYFTALAYQGMDQNSDARNYFKKAADTEVGDSEYLYYRALSQFELGQEKDADASIEQLIRSGEAALENTGDADFFAKFGEKADADTRKAHAYYLMALGYRASGAFDQAREYFNRALELRNSMLWAHVYGTD